MVNRWLVDQPFLVSVDSYNMIKNCVSRKNINALGVSDFIQTWSSLILPMHLLGRSGLINQMESACAARIFRTDHAEAIFLCIVLN